MIFIKSYTISLFYRVENLEKIFKYFIKVINEQYLSIVFM